MVFWSQASRFQALRFHLQGSSASGFQSSSWFQASNLPGKGFKRCKVAEQGSKVPGYKAWRCDGARFEGCAVPGIHGFRFQGFHGAKVRVPGSWVSKHPGIQTRQRFQDQVSVPRDAPNAQGPTLLPPRFQTCKGVRFVSRRSWCTLLRPRGGQRHDALHHRSCSASYLGLCLLAVQARPGRSISAYVKL